MQQQWQADQHPLDLKVSNYDIGAVATAVKLTQVEKRFDHLRAPGTQQPTASRACHTQCVKLTPCHVND
jgi:hypothetical protein